MYRKFEISISSCFPTKTDDEDSEVIDGYDDFSDIYVELQGLDWSNGKI